MWGKHQPWPVNASIFRDAYVHITMQTSVVSSMKFVGLERFKTVESSSGVYGRSLVTIRKQYIYKLGEFEMK